MHKWTEPKALVTIHRDTATDVASVFVTETTCLDECAALLRMLAPGTRIYLCGDGSACLSGRAEAPTRRRRYQRATK